jgi:hypothetical protein
MPEMQDMEPSHLMVQETPQVEISTPLSSEIYHSKLLNTQSKNISLIVELSMRLELPKTETPEK